MAGNTGPLGRSNRQRQPTGAFPAVSHASAPSHLLLQIDTGPITTIGCQVKEQVVIGRTDPEYQPDVDLVPYGAADKGVSRKHALIKMANNTLYIQDSDSRNGTRLNGHLLEKGRLYPLNDGDVLLLGNLQIIVWYVD